MRNNFLILSVFTAVLLFASGGCGYTADPLIREDIKTVHVEYFENNTWRQGLEVNLARALADEIKLHGAMRYTGRNEADSVIRGEILRYSVDSVTRTADDRLLMKRVTVGIRYCWEDGLSGRQMVPWTTLEQSVQLAVEQQEDEAVRAFQKVAQQLVQSFESKW